MLCLLTVFVCGACQRGAEPSQDTDRQEHRSADAAEQSSGNAQVVVTYFHTTFRCPTCRRLEEYSREAVESAFGKELEQGKVAFRALNVEETDNQHFIKDYSLYTKSLIVSLNKNGKETRWKNLPDIWKLVRDREQYEKYVVGEIEDYLKDL
jgi:thiol-disulfide isomerase/thioredoxin